MYDLLSVRRDALVREFYAYLFREAIVCVAEEKRRSLGRFLLSASGAAASTFTDGASVTSAGSFAEQHPGHPWSAMSGASLVKSSKGAMARAGVTRCDKVERRMVQGSSIQADPRTDDASSYAH
jgi:hypothetical protein